MEDLGFHWKDGWFFKRLPDARVHVRKFETANPDSKLIVEAVIDPSSWDSIVASVSFFGETSANFAMLEIMQKGY